MSTRSPVLVALLAAGMAGAWEGRAAAVESRLGELNCAACHAASPRQSAWLSPQMAPRLTDAGARLNPDWLRRFLAAPQGEFPGTAMPDLLHGMEPEERAAAADALTHYLVSLGSGGFHGVMPDRAAVARGEELYHKIGCVACHGPQNVSTVESPRAPLPDLQEKWSFDGLRRFLKDPLASRLSGRMPGMRLTDREASDLAHYLVRRTRVSAPLEMIQFRGPIHSLGELDTAGLARTGPALDFSLDQTNRDRGSPVRFNGWLRVEQGAEYTFYLTASGASRFAIDGDWLNGDESWDTGQVDEKRQVRLEPGPHSLTVDYVERGSKTPSLKMEWEGPGLARGVIPSARLSSERDPVAVPVAFQLDPARAARGRALYAKLNCAACHEANAPTKHAPPAMSALRNDRGCLAGHPDASAPDYHFDATQREAVRAELTALNRPELPSPASRQQLSLTLAAFNCTACHIRDGVGGPKPALEAFFTSNGDDLGDEGRLPPRLNGVGDKLRPGWLAKVLAGGAGVRPYLNTRMPVFGVTNIGTLADLFITLDRQAALLKPVFDPAEVQRDAGRQLAGTDGLSCVVCHRFNRQPAQTLQVMDLTTTTPRLNEDWFREFLRDPNRFHPGTRMPSFWPNGVSLLPAVLGGDTARQQAALWTYLADGSLAKTPAGLSRQSLELIVGGEPIVYRGKLWEAGYRAIAAGYPGGVNTAFDAEEMRLALLWRGQFLNAGPHWTVQGMGQIHPLGTNVVILPHGSPLAVLTNADAPWPAGSAKSIGLKFHGCQLDALKRPTWLYSFQGLGIQDFSVPIAGPGKPGLRRTITFSEPLPGGLYLRLATGKLAPVGENAWRLDAAVTLTVKNPGHAFTRGQGDHQELLVPVKSLGKNQSVEVGYVW